MAYPKGKLVKVEMDDLTGKSPWRRAEDAKDDKPTRCIIVGFLVGSSRKTITVAANLADNGDIGDSSIILRKSILNITPLMEVKQKQGGSDARKV